MSHSTEQGDNWENRSDEAQSDELGDRDIVRIIDFEDLISGGKTIRILYGGAC